MAAADIKDLRFPVIANVTAAPVVKADDIRKLLTAQVTGAVRWRESMLFAMENGVDTIVEAGAGKVLSGLAKRISPDLKAVTLNTPADIESFLKTL